MSNNQDNFTSQHLSSDDEIEMPNSQPLSSDVMEPTPSASTSDAYVPQRGQRVRGRGSASKRGGRSGGRGLFGRTSTATSSAASEDPDALPSSSNVAQPTLSTPATPNRGGRPRKQVATLQE